MEKEIDTDKELLFARARARTQRVTIFVRTLHWSLLMFPSLPCSLTQTQASPVINCSTGSPRAEKNLDSCPSSKSEVKQHNLLIRSVNEPTCPNKLKKKMSRQWQPVKRIETCTNKRTRLQHSLKQKNAQRILTRQNQDCLETSQG